MGLKVSPGALHPRRIVMRSTGAGRRIVIRPSASGGSGGGVTDHGALTGLGDDDHPQYALADGTRGAFATTAQGDLADTAVQPSALSDAITAHTAATDPHGDRAYTDAQIIASLANFVAGAPGILDTWLEMVTAIQADQTGLAALTTVVAGKLAKASNLSDLADIPTARTNLGLGSAATTAASAYDAAGTAAAAQAAAIAAAATDATTKADAKVADAINDGTTTVAPSQNAVFDALALKPPTSRTIAGLDLSADRTAAVLLAALSGQAGADFALNGHKLTGVATGTSAQDAVTKAQLDTKGDLVATHGFRLVGNSVRDYCIPGEAIVTGTSTAAPSSNRCQFERWRLRSAQTFDRVAMEVTAAGGAGKLIRMSVWSVDGYGQPAALIADFGTIDANSATFQALTISLTLPAGDYIGVWVSDGSPTVRTVHTYLLGSNALAGVGSTTPIRNQATFAGSGIAAGGFPSTPGSGVGAVTIERDIFTGSTATASAMRLREVA